MTTIDHWDNTLCAMSKAMTDLVLPALDPSDQLVYEQAGLVAKFLAHLSARLPWYYDRNRAELVDAAHLAEVIEGDAHAFDEVLGGVLVEALEEAREVLDSPGASVPQLQVATARVTAIVSAVVRSLGERDADEDLRRRIERNVVAASLSSIEAQRAWFLDQGWEPDATAVAGLDGALRR